MIDLTNKNIDEINAFIQKYAQALEVIPREEQPVMAYIIKIAKPYVDEKYGEYDVNLKACSMVMLLKLQNIVTEDNDIRNLIDEFFKYFNSEFKSFAHELYPQSSADGMIYEFMARFTNKKLGI